MELLTFIHRFMFSLRALFLVFISAPLLLCSTNAQAGYTQVIHTEQDCGMVETGAGSYTLTCRPVVKVEYVWVPDPAPPPRPATAPPPPPVNCGIEKRRSNVEVKKCSQLVVEVKTNAEATCSEQPVSSTRELSPELAATVGFDGKLFNGNLVIKVGGRVMEEYHPKASCLGWAANAVLTTQARCDTEQAKRELAMAQAGCE